MSEQKEKRKQIEAKKEEIIQMYMNIFFVDHAAAETEYNYMIEEPWKYDLVLIALEKYNASSIKNNPIKEPPVNKKHNLLPITEYDIN
jgi:hypothetical protein